MCNIFNIFNNIKNILYIYTMKTNPVKTIIICAFLAIVIFFSLKSCETVPKIQQVHDTLKINVIKWRDSVRVKTEVRTKVITKYSQVRYDSLIPCETKLYYCDTVVLADSALIAAQRETIYLDSVYLAAKDKLITDTCKYFKKQIRKQKIQKWLILIGAVGSHAVIK